MKNLLIGLLIFPATVFAQHNSIQINFSIKGMPDGIKFYLYDQREVIDSARSENENFVFNYLKQETGPKGMMVVSSDNKQGFLIWLEDKNILLDGLHGQDLPLSASGSSSQNDFREYMLRSKLTQASLDSLTKLFKFQKAKKSLDTTLLGKQMENISDKLEKINIGFLQDHPASVISTYMLLLETKRQNFTPTQSLDLFHLLEHSQQNSAYGQEILRAVQLYKNPQISQPAPDFSMPDINKKQVTLGDFKGKNIVLIFWASWCGPCRKESENLKRLYNEMQKASVVCIAVSLDNNKDAWHKAILQDEMNAWINLSDLKGWASEAALVYGINSIPNHFLINKEGQLVCKETDLRVFESAVKAFLK